MGFLERRREAKEQRQFEAARSAVEHAVATAQTAVDEAARAAKAAMLSDYVLSVPGVVLKEGEVAYLIVNEVAFVEPKRLPGQWTGGSQGVSFRVAKGVRYRVGGSRGTFEQGKEVLQPTDKGTFVVTNHRCLFVGSKRTTEWLFTKLVGFSLEGEGVAIFNVSNRQKATGVFYGSEVEAQADAVVAAAIAKSQSDAAHEGLVAEMKSAVGDALQELERAKAAGPVPQE